MNQPITNAEAIRRYPELHALLTARQAGWIFRTIAQDGQPVSIYGSYSRQQYTDALVISDRTHVTAARVLNDTSGGGGCAWSKEGADLDEIVHDLLALPEPDDRLAPKLVTRSSLLWRP
jgi:hypothetical protein